MLDILPDNANVIFSPRGDDRTYTPAFRVNLMGGADWAELTGIIVSDNGTERTLTDTNATEGAKSYRIRIAAP